LGPYQPDFWLAAQIGRSVYKFHASPKGELPPSPCFCYAKIPAQDQQLAKDLESEGFRQVETLETYEKIPKEDGASDPRVRPARPEDRRQVQQIARLSFRLSRFHADPALGFDVGNRLKEAWVGNFFEGLRGSRLLVAEVKSRLAGFILLVESPEAVQVDLIAVRNKFQGKGWGRILLTNAEKAGKKISAGTQRINAQAARMYTACGYRLAKAESVFHLHR